MTETIRFENFSGLRRSRQWRSSFVPRQATYLAAHRPGVPGRVVTFTDFKTWPNSMPNTTHPPHANGTQGPQGDQITSIEASFVFHSLKTRKLSIRPHHREVHRVAAKVTPPPARPRDVQKDSSGPRTSGWELELENQIWSPPETGRVRPLNCRGL